MVGLFRRSSVMASSGCFFGMVICVFFYSLLSMEGGVVIEWFMNSGLMNLNFIFVLDGFSLLFSFVVLFISFFIMLFSTSYMENEVHLSRFIWLVVLFVVSMNFLIYVPSLIGVILGWDGLGLISFLLVIYYQNGKSLGAGLVTAFMNRVGDSLLLLGVSLMSTSGHWSFWGWGGSDVLSMALGLIVVLSCTKSAQFPFSYWLPAAMSAPTPVSALVHSSTLVTAGVYMLVRIVPNVGSESAVGGWWLLTASLFTTLMAGMSACFEMDMKKVVALSTLSQLGVMMFSLSLGYYCLAFFHLLSHALFKALLFVGIGCVIHGHEDWQDFRMVSGLWSKAPLVAGSIVLALLALSGLPFLGAFYSKDLVVEGMLEGGVSLFLGLVGGLGLMMTLIYSGRLFFSGVFSNFSLKCAQSGESHISMYEFIPLVCLTAISSLGGWLLQGLMFEFSSLFLLEIYYKNFINFIIFIGLIAVFCCVLLKAEMFYVVFGLKDFVISFFSTMSFMAYLVPITNFLFMKGSGDSYKVVDLGWNEGVFGGLSLFDYVLALNKMVLSLMWGTVSRCFLFSLMLFLSYLFLLS
uniref:NADH dehydrogenase subunit 5 n=1 Tax=Pillucina pisidium (Dunker, 1860) TaxID=244488 RepID=UPI00233F7A90|nr:NADH dehydrogenase subunit 5 [Pillucina pisidium (Dunker, 1860)]WBR65415.1 NADH dehydrogenase subunit 5 [Pillucina pisidium (Dunker, 1860)]